MRQERQGPITIEKRRLTVLKRAYAGALALTLLTACEYNDTTPQPRATTSGSAIENALCDSMKKLGDSDCDRVSDTEDVLPGADDNADYDKDLVANKYDKFPGLDDKTIDIDGDTIPEYLDTYFGLNTGDVDQDGILNGYDIQPYTLNHVAPPAAIPAPELRDMLAEQQMRRAVQKKVAKFDKDSDYDGVPDHLDATQDWYSNDRDGDNDTDFYDPKPSDPYVNSRNDPYDPRNEKYWEK